MSGNFDELVIEEMPGEDTKPPQLTLEIASPELQKAMRGDVFQEREADKYFAGWTDEQKADVVGSTLGAEAQARQALALFGSVEKAYAVARDIDPESFERYLGIEWAGLGQPKQLADPQTGELDSKKLFRLLANAPATSKWLSYPENVARSTGFEVNLVQAEDALTSRHGSIWGQMWWGLKTLPGQMGSSVYGALAGLTYLIPDEPVGREYEEYLVQSAQVKSALNPPLTGDVSGVRRFVADLPATVGQIGIYAAASAVHPAAGISLIGAQEFGGAYNQLRQSGISPNSALLGAMSTAIIATPLEAMQLRGLGKMIGAHKAAGGVFTRQFAKKVFFESFVQGTQEFTQGMAETLGQVVGETVEGTPLTWEGLKQKAREDFGEWAYAGMQAAAASVLIGYGGAAFQAKRNTTLKDFTLSASIFGALKKVTKEVEPLAAKDPQAAESFVETLLDKGLKDEASVSAEDCESFFQTQENKDAQRKEFLRRLGVSEEQYKDALEGKDGGEVKFKLSTFLAQLGNTPVGRALLKNVSVSGVPSFAEVLPKQKEAEEDFTDVVASLTEAVVISDEELSPDKFKEWQKVLVDKAGMDESVAKAHVVLMRALYNLYAQQEGVSIAEALEKVKLDISIEPGKTVFKPKTKTLISGKIDVKPLSFFISIFKGAKTDTMFHELTHAFLELSLQTEGLKDQARAAIEELKTGTSEREAKEALVEEFVRMFTLESARMGSEHEDLFGNLASWLAQVYEDVSMFTPLDQLSPKEKILFQSWLSAMGTVDESVKLTEDLTKPKMLPDDTAGKKPRPKTKSSKPLNKAAALAKAAVKKLQNIATKNTTKARAEEEVKNSPSQKAADALVSNKAYVSIHQIEELLDLNTAEAAAMFDKIKKFTRQLTTQGGEDSHLASDDELLDAAVNSGYDSVEEMFEAWAGEDSYSARVKTAQERMDKELQDAFSEAISEENPDVLSKMHDDATLALYLTVLDSILAKRNQQTGLAKYRARMKKIKARIRAELRQMRLRESLRNTHWHQQEKKAYKKAVALAKQGKQDAAADMLETAIHYFIRVQESLKLRKEYDKAKRKFSYKKLISKFKNISADTYAPAIQKILRYYGLWTYKEGSGNYNLSFLPELSDVGITQSIPGWIMQGVDISGNHNTRDLTYDEFAELTSTISYLLRLGEGDLVSRRIGKFQSFEELRKDSLERLKKQKPSSIEGFIFQVKKGFRRAAAFLRSPERHAEQVDGGQTDGPFSSVFRELVKGDLNIKALMQNIEKQLRPVFKTFTEGRKQWNAKYRGQSSINGVELPTILREQKQISAWSFDQILALALNLGNESNIQTATQSDLGLKLEDITALVSSIDKDTLQSLQGVWDTLNQLFPPLAEKTLLLQNRVLPKVEAKPIILTADDGAQVILEGGYYPIRFDPALVSFNVDENLSEDIGIEAIFRAALNNNASATIERVKYAEGSKTPVIRLDLQTILSHISRTALYIHKTEAMLDMHKLLVDPEWKAAYLAVYGEESYNELRKYLVDMANPKRAAVDVDAFEKFLLKGKKLFTLKALFMNIPVAGKQALSWFQAISEMNIVAGNGERHMAKSLAMFAGMLRFSQRNETGEEAPLSVTELWDWINENSELLRLRTSAGDVDIQEAMKTLKANPSLLERVGGALHLSDIQNFGFLPIRTVDGLTVRIVWMAAYQQALAENMEQAAVATTEEEKHKAAVAYADHIVRVTQPSVLESEMSAIQRKAGLWRVALAFKTWAFKYGQLLASRVRSVASGKLSATQIAKVFAYDIMAPSLTLYTIQALIVGAFYDYPDEDEQVHWDELPFDIANNISRTLPIVEQAYEALVMKREPTIPAYDFLMQSAWGTLRVVDDFGFNTDTLIDSEQLLELFTGIHPSKPTKDAYNALKVVGAVK